MALGHASICDCNECTTERRSGGVGGTQGVGVEVNDPHLARLLDEAEAYSRARASAIGVPFTPAPEWEYTDPTEYADAGVVPEAPAELPPSELLAAIAANTAALEQLTGAVLGIKAAIAAEMEAAGLRVEAAMDAASIRPLRR